MTVFLGASFVEPGSPIVSAYAAATGKPAEARGARGASLTAWAAAAGADALSGPTPALVVEMGGNTARVTPGDIEAADARLRAAGYRPTWVYPPPWPEGAPATVSARRATMRAAIAAANVSKLDSGWSPELSELARDGIHLSRGAYEDFGRAIAAAKSAKAPAALIKAAAVAVAVVLVFTLWSRGT